MKYNYIDVQTRSIVSLSPPVWARGWTINRVSVLPPHRGKGLARQLLEQVCDDADREQVNLWLEVRPDGAPGSLDFIQIFHFYERLGFRPINEPPVMMRQPQQPPAWELADALEMLYGNFDII